MTGELRRKVAARRSRNQTSRKAMAAKKAQEAQEDGPGEFLAAYDDPAVQQCAAADLVQC